MISPSLKQKVAISIFTITLQKNKKFRSLFANKIQEKISKNERLGTLVSANKILFNKLEQNIINMIVINLTTELKQPEDVII
jgi:CRP-like cAMP-binding protein